VDAPAFPEVGSQATCKPRKYLPSRYHVPMKARIFITLAFAVIIPALLAQTTRHKAATPSTAAPTKVTGDGISTASGLQYWDIKVGTGGEAKEGDHVKVHYTGWFTDGKKFDSSVDAHQPYDFTLGKGEVIKGWDEGITGMKVGGKRQLRIPPVLAYGEAGYKDIVPPNATLIFDVQLLAVTPAPEAPPAADPAQK
jgi:FKBP-type peptidyl-prolyl cis-trans isomerase